MTDNVSSDAELRPCPFCGSADVELRVSITDAGVACNNCGCRTGLVQLGRDEASEAYRKREVIGLWNTRIADTLRAEPVGWQPIETAPRTGERILTWGYLHDDGGPYEANGQSFMGEMPAVQITWFSGVTGSWVSVEWGSHEPTYWMPLPDPPISSLRGNE